MKIYTFGFQDGHSDDGYGVIIVGEHRKDLAKKEAMNHLEEMGRTDISENEVELKGFKDLDSSSIIYSNVQG